MARSITDDRALEVKLYTVSLLCAMCNFYVLSKHGETWCMQHSITSEDSLIRTVWDTKAVSTLWPDANLVGDISAQHKIQ